MHGNEILNTMPNGFVIKMLKLRDYCATCTKKNEMMNGVILIGCDSQKDAYINI